jgi:hypothetical protein
VLRSCEVGNCILLGARGCTAHPGRPLACRLFLLARLPAPCSETCGDQGALTISGGKIAVPERPLLGIEIDRKAIAVAHALYKEHGLGARDDALAMQFLIPGWTFDDKRPCLVR